MRHRMQHPFQVCALSLGLAARLLSQQPNDDPQRITLTALRTFAIYAKVQLSDGAALGTIDEELLRGKLELALRREGIAVVAGNDVRDGSAAHLSLVYLVIPTRTGAGEPVGFAASSCLQAAQMVTVPRLTTPKHIAYAMAPTWRSCSMVVGDTSSYRGTILQNADEQIARFIEAWRTVNRPAPPPASPLNPELGMGKSPDSQRSPDPNGELA